MGGSSLTDISKDKLPSSRRIIIWIALIIVGLLDIGSCSVVRNAREITSTIEPNDLCTTQSCKNAVERIVKKMDQTVEPCDDFYQFTCGTYLNSKDSDDKEPSQITEWDLIQEVSRKIENQLISSLNKTNHIDDSEPVKIAKSLYQKCLNTSAFDNQDLSPFLDILEQVGGWPVLKQNKTWNETAFNWDRLIFKIGDRSYWDNIFIPLKPYKINESFKILLSEPTLGLDELDLLNGTQNNNVKNYLKYMIDIAVSMGANETYAAKELNDTLEFEIKLANITLGDEKNLDANDQSIKSISFSSLENNYSFIPWDEYMDNKLSFNIVPDNKIYFFDLNYINNLKNLIESTPKRVIANYVIWRHIDDFAYYLNKTIRDIKVNYKNANVVSITENTFDNNTQKTQSTDCFKFLVDNMKLVLSFIYAHENLDEDTMSKVSTIFDNVQSEFVELVENATWLDSETRKRTLKKVKNIFPVISYPRAILYDFITDEFLRDLNFVNDSYMENLFNIRMYNRDFLLRCTNEVDADDCNQLITCRNNALGADVYSPLNGNLMCVSARYFQNTIMYNNNFPMYMNYGRTGNALGHEVAHVLDKNEYNMLDSVKWPEKIDNIYLSKAECIMEQYSKFKHSGLENSKTITKEDIADNSGIRAAYFAYTKLSGMERNQKIMDKVYTPQQMFWISAASIWCKKPNDTIVEDSWHRLYNRIPKSQIIGSFSNMKEFADDFNCPKDAPMNPSNKCAVW